ncbi:alpha/beta hydrolase [Kytococcus sedentarius]|uniref:alpha/beta hydrolase n=1 Tax=Kytococcus sedentarius TaxID=1276 RepID=UPI00065FA529|nr:alpha/beta hydrolase [Kytococcus sedentarius]
MRWSDLLQWEGSALSEQSQNYERDAKSLTSASEQLEAQANGLSGSGKTVTAAQQALRRNVAAMRKQASNLKALASIVGEAAGGTNQIGESARSLDGTAANHSLHIEADGSVHYVGPRRVSPTEAATIKKNMKAVADRVSSIMKSADELVQATQSKISALSSGGQAHANGTASAARAPRKNLKLPPKGASEKEVAKWWSSLSDAEKEQMIKDHPKEIGNLNGVDGTSRDKANRIVLPQALASEKKKLENLKQRYGAHPSRRERQQIERVEERIKALEQVDETLKKAGDDHIPRQLLSLETSGQRVLAAVAQGNVDTADHIGVVVPGLYSNVANNLQKYDDDATAMGENAQRYTNGGSVAMISYLGYEAPQDIAQVTDIGYAQKGADKLAGFLNGLDASRERGAGDAHITVAGHSYGSTTAGIALTKVNDGVVDDLIQFGSPGSGVQDVSEFNLPRGHAWVSATDYKQDMVQGMGDDGRFGKNPDTMEGYNHLSGDVGEGDGSFYPFSKHNGYFNRGSHALNDISRVIAGEGRR